MSAKLTGLALATLAIFGLSVQTTIAAQSQGGYTITEWDTQITVNPDKTYAITETVDADFREPRHGIFRGLKRQETLYREDGTRQRTRVNITDIQANTPMAITTEGDKMILRLGDPEQTLLGPYQFVISYLYNAGRDQYAGADEFYMNLVPDDHDTPIEAAQFTITFPQEFEPLDLGFSVGQWGEYNSDRVTYDWDGQTLTGQTGRLEPGETVTVRVLLPDGYFVDPPLFINWPVVIGLVSAVLAGLVVYLWWAAHGRDDPVIETVEFYPPAGLNSAQVGMIYDGGLSEDAKISLLLYLAQGGYLRIEETGKTSRRQSFAIHRVRDYDGTDAAAKKFFDGLFAHGSPATGADLEDTFYVTLQEVEQLLTSDARTKSWWDQRADRYQNISLVIATLVLIAAYLIPSLQVFVNWNPLFYVSVFYFIVVGAMKTHAARKGVEQLLAILAIVLAGSWVFLIVPPMWWDQGNLILNGFHLAIGIAILYGAYYMGKLTPEGTRTLGQVRGFRRFLETAEKPKLEALVKDDPQYFYNILPFTFALGVSDVWVKQFRTLAVAPPAWYQSRDPFEAARFHHFLTSTMQDARSTMTSRPSSSGSGGSSGGGFSGGGGGGGSVGSW